MHPQPFLVRLLTLADVLVYHFNFSKALPQDFVQRAATFLITRFILLNPSDLEGWMADPEDWVNVEDKDDEQWEFQIRVCPLIQLFLMWL